MKREKTTKFHHGLITFSLLTAIMFFSIVVCGADPQVPLIGGCVAASAVAIWTGYKWADILESMLSGISQALEAILILLCIGILVSTWIASGTVPTMIYYGLKFVSPRFFLLTAFVLCSVISMITGAWGAAGSVGLAFMGIGQIIGASPAAVAGAVVAGSYVGDKVSPFSDSTNLAASVAKCNVFDMIRQMIPICALVYILSAAAYALLGLWSFSDGSAQIQADILPLMDAIAKDYYVSAFSMLPLFVMLACVAFRVPSIPAILAGAAVGAVQAAITQGYGLADLLQFTTSGYISETGNQMLDELLSAGGIESMLPVISIIIIAMGFGGIMQGSGQTAALVAPLVRCVRSKTGIVALTILSCVGVNALLPDQYLGVMVPGQMYAEEYKKRGIDERTLGNVLGAGASVTSALIPWNTCGTYIVTILGVGAAKYIPYSFFNLLLPAAMIVYIFLKERDAYRAKVRTR